MKTSIAVLLMGTLMTYAASTQKYGILNQKAPAWKVDEWFQLAEGVKSIDVADFKGKVIYLYCFQSWCPGCHKHGFPALQKVQERFKDDDDVVCLAVQTTFEGYGVNDAAAALKTAKKFNLKMPIGHSGGDEKRSGLMTDYRTGGTPWTVVIDKKGIVRFNGFHLDPKESIPLIEKLKKTKGDE